MTRWMTLAIALILAPSAQAGIGVSTFEDLSVPANSTLLDAGPSGQFVSGGASFNNTYDPNSGVTGWAISSTTDTTTPGYPSNLYSAITGSGASLTPAGPLRRPTRSGTLTATRPSARPSATRIAPPISAPTRSTRPTPTSPWPRDSRRCRSRSPTRRMPTSTSRAATPPASAMRSRRATSSSSTSGATMRPAS